MVHILTLKQTGEMRSEMLPHCRHYQYTVHILGSGPHMMGCKR